MYRKFDKSMLKASLMMSVLFSIVVCLTVYFVADDPYMLWDLAKVLKNGDLSPIKLTLGVALPILFLSIIITMFSIAYYKVECTAEEESKKEKMAKKKIKPRRKRIKKDEE